MKKKVLVQMGHVAPREPGFESGTGTAGEIEVVSKIGRELAAHLVKDGRFIVTLCPGDIPDEWTGDVVLSLHCDGSDNPKASGYCFGWHPPEYGGKTIRFVRCLETTYESIKGHPHHRGDNYTIDMREYYGWHHTIAPVKVLIEHGFLTNKKEAKWIKKNIKNIAHAEYVAFLLYFGLRSA